VRSRPSLNSCRATRRASGSASLRQKTRRPEFVDRLNKEVNAALADLNMKARLAEWGTTALPGSPADFGKLIAAETEKWTKVIKLAGIEPE
jgi:tripartite-type tricarboxylate transporter receptor subunit TctC